MADQSALCLPSNHKYDILVRIRFRLAMVAIVVVVFTVGAIAVAAGEASSAYSLLEFGNNGKRNMLYDARQRPQSVLLHGRLYVVYNGDASATKNGKGNAYPMFISYDPQSALQSDRWQRMEVQSPLCEDQSAEP